jgi:hypothetical protein
MTVTEICTKLKPDQSLTSIHLAILPRTHFSKAGKNRDSFIILRTMNEQRKRMKQAKVGG